MAKIALAQTMIYVDDDYNSQNTIEQNGGHSWGVDAFNTIQEGINAVTDGGTVNISAGNYATDNLIIISRAMKLIGPGINAEENKRAFMNNSNSCSDPIFSVEASNVRIEGLYIQSDNVGFCNTYYPTIKVIADSDDNPVINTEIIGNDISGGNHGIALRYDSASSTIDGNNIHDNLNYGIAVGGSKNNLISNNIINNNRHGISFFCGFYCVKNTGSSNALINSNIIDSNADAGIYIDSGITGISIQNNTITNDGHFEKGAIGIHLISALGNSAHYNSIYNTIVNDIDNVGADNEDEENSFNATQNYWGDSAGPFQAETNTSGNTDSSVLGLVNYSPWHTDAGLTILRGNMTGGENDFKSFAISEEYNVTISGFSLIIPAGTVITGTSTWNGQIDPPAVKTALSSYPEKEDYTTEILSMIEVGFSSGKLTLSQAAKLILSGEHNKLIGYTRPGEPFTEITAVCGENSQAWADANLSAEGDCKINSNNDLVVWTKHLTSFATYTQTAINHGSIISSAAPFAAPVGGFKISINNGAAETEAVSVMLNLNGGNALRMAISNDENFTNISQELYSNSKGWMLSTGYGLKTVYAKFFDKNGTVSRTVKAEITLKEISSPQIATTTPEVKGEKIYADGALLRGSDKKIYIVVGNKLKLILNLTELKQYAGRQIFNVDDSVIAGYDKILVLGIKQYADGTLLRGSDKKIYEIINGQKKYIINLDELRMYYFGKPIIDVSDDIINQY